MQYETKKAKMERLINDKLEPSSSDDETENDFDHKNDNESDNDPEKAFKNLKMSLIINNLLINIRIKTVF